MTPDVRATVNGRPVLTTTQAAARYGYETVAGLRATLSRLGVQPADELDARTPLYDLEGLDTVMATIGRPAPLDDATEPRDLPAGDLRWDGQALTVGGVPLAPGRYRVGGTGAHLVVEPPGGDDPEGE